MTTVKQLTKNASWPALSLVASSALIACVPAPAPISDLNALAQSARYQPAAGDVVNVPGLGSAGKWMLTSQLKAANWLGAPLGGKALREPVNLILLDRAAVTPQQATQRMLRAMNQADYGPKKMHSGGYYAYFNGQVMRQFPRERGQAFSSGPWYQANNHGRIFGPFKIAGAYVFLGALSRENFDPLARPWHTFNSFTVAREDLATKLTAHSVFKRSGYVDMHSRLTDDATTADHDGRAALLIANGIGEEP